MGRAAAIDSYVQGVLAYNAGNKPKAIKDLEEATRQHPTLVMAHSMLGDIYQSDRRYSDALAQYEITAQLDPGAYKNHYNEGLMEQLLGRVKEAIASYLRALKLQPADFLTNQNLGAAYLQLGDYDSAIKYSKRATELNDKSAPALSNLARAYEGKEQWKEAEGCWRKVLELDGSATNAAVALALNLKHQQKYDESRQILTDVVHASDTPAHRKLLGDALFLDKKYDQALEQYAQALKLDPKYLPALNETGWVLITEYNQSLGLDEPKRTAALQAWRKSLAIDPNQLQVQKLAATYAEKMTEPGK
jgi:tetratricopeptide (TPR) repeat protein